MTRFIKMLTNRGKFCTEIFNELNEKFALENYNN